MTHAFFKALLFLGAGSVIHALSGEQDLRKMGGLRKNMPITCVTLFCAGLAIAGFPFTSGFFSKDEILAAAYHARSMDVLDRRDHRGHDRLLCVPRAGSWPSSASIAATRIRTNRRWSMTGPLMILAAALAGRRLHQRPALAGADVSVRTKPPVNAWMKYRRRSRRLARHLARVHVLRRQARLADSVRGRVWRPVHSWFTTSISSMRSTTPRWWSP